MHTECGDQTDSELIPTKAQRQKKMKGTKHKYREQEQDNNMKNFSNIPTHVNLRSLEDKKRKSTEFI